MIEITYYIKVSRRYMRFYHIGTWSQAMNKFLSIIGSEITHVRVI